MKQYNRQQVVKRLRAKLASGRIIVAAGAGTGISAKFEEEGGADLIMVFNSGRYRMHGLGSLSGWMAYGNANDVAMEMGEQNVLPIIKEVPVVCSVNATDPTRVMDRWLKKVKDAGFSGVNNFPTMGMIDGNFRAGLEETGMSFDKEVEVIQIANKMGLFTMPYAFTPEEARKMAKAGCDCLLAHVGLTVGGSIGAKTTLSIDEAAQVTKKMAEAAWAVNPDVLILCHGGPISTPADVITVLKKVPIHGFVGASSMERLPVERGIKDITAAFAEIKWPKRKRK
jgi:predicted TIM-barrel enzyme